MTVLPSAICQKFAETYTARFQKEYPGKALKSYRIQWKYLAGKFGTPEEMETVVRKFILGAKTASVVTVENLVSQVWRSKQPNV